MSAGDAPRLQALWLGRQLRQLREEAGKTLQEAGSYLQRNQSTVSRFESAEYPVRRPDVLALFEFYGVTDATRRKALLRLCEDVWAEGWWEEYNDVAGSSRLLDYVRLESRATSIQLFGAMLLPGLLQTPDYARVLIRRWDTDAVDEKIDRQVELRMDRQKILRGDNPVALQVVLDEAVLHRPMGRREIHVDQLNHLLDLMTVPTIDLRIVPFSAGWHASLEGSYTVYEMPPPYPYPRVGYIETAGGMVQMEGEWLAHLQSIFGNSQDLAADSARSRDHVTRVRNHFEE
jgi:transcriptional regulator with XRE-family HTH domain